MAKKGTHKERALERLGDLSTIDPSLARAMIKVLKATLGQDDRLPSGPISFGAFHDAMVSALPGFYSPVDIPFTDLKRTATVLAVALRNQEDLDAFTWWVSRQGWLAKDPALNRVINALSRSIVHVRVEYRRFLESAEAKEMTIQTAEQIASVHAKRPRDPRTSLPFARKTVVSSHG